MPLTKKGRTVLRSLAEQHGRKKGTSILHAMINKGTLKGAHKGN